MAEVVEEFVAEAFALVGTRDQSGDVEEFDGDATGTVLTSAVVGFAATLKGWSGVGLRGLVAREGGAGAGAGEVEVAYGVVGLDGGEGKVACSQGTTVGSAGDCGAERKMRGSDDRMW